MSMNNGPVREDESFLTKAIDLWIYVVNYLIESFLC